MSIAFGQKEKYLVFLCICLYMCNMRMGISEHILGNTRVTESFNILSRYVTIWETGDNNFSNQIVHRKGKIAWFRRVGKWQKKGSKEIPCVTYLCVTHQGILLSFQSASKKGLLWLHQRALMYSGFWISLSLFLPVSIPQHFGIKSGNISLWLVPVPALFVVIPFYSRQTFIICHSVNKCSAKIFFLLGTWLVHELVPEVAPGNRLLELRLWD